MGEGNEWALKGLTALIEHGDADSWGTMAMSYLAYIATVKPFPDKNEQVALMAAEIFLNLNGKALTLSEGDALQLVQAVTAGQLRGEALNNALNGNIENLQK